jgi:transcriptional regulator with PAS, ATPase and Fis domain
VLQERMIEPLGSVEPMKVDVRIVAATNRDLSQLVHEGRFREDLYYRVHVISLSLPSLSQRREDIPLLVDHLVAKLNRIQGREIEGISDEVMAQLMEYEYPGNVRELENIIEQAFVLCRGRLIELHHLPAELRPSGAASFSRSNPMSLQAMEKLLISEALRRHKGCRSKAAKQLGVNPSTLYRKLKALKIDFQKGDILKQRRVSAKKAARGPGN